MVRAVALLCCFGTWFGRASTFQTIGVDELRRRVPSLNGAGVVVAHPEAGAPAWQVNPAEVGQPMSLFTWSSSAGTTNAFPNSLGNESYHANEVGRSIYGLTNGIAPGVAHVQSYDASHLYSAFIAPQGAISASIINQSFVVMTEDPTLDREYDDYVARHGTIIVSAVGNGGPVFSPASAHNVIGVGAYGGGSSVGPTLDGRSKPDITAPSTYTSFSAPLVSGCVTLLVQAALRNDGGPATATLAADVRTIKALLLNGANKPADWNNTTVTPLDARYGAGIVNVANSYGQLRGGRHLPNASEGISVGSPHPPAATSNNVPSRRGWDANVISSSVIQHGVKHYFVDLSAASGRDLKATLVWNRGQGETSINNLDLFVYDAGTGVLVGSSQSAVDNVEHVWLRDLPPARYNIQVLKQGGPAGHVTPNENYALAFEFGPVDAPYLSNEQLMGTELRARVNGEPNQRYAVETSSDLVRWSAITTNLTSAAGVFLFTNSPALPQCIYRAVERW